MQICKLLFLYFDFQTINKIVDHESYKYRYFVSSNICFCFKIGNFYNALRVIIRIKYFIFINKNTYFFSYYILFVCYVVPIFEPIQCNSKVTPEWKQKNICSFITASAFSPKTSSLLRQVTRILQLKICIYQHVYY